MFDLSAITSIGARLYMDRPNNRLYHYTSVGSVLRIVEGRELFATDSRYLNDTSELQVFVSAVKAAMASSDPNGDFAYRLHLNLGTWLDNRLSELGHSIFVACFTEDGNLLSQWRSYGDPRKGISIGFNQDKLAAVAHAQGFMVGRCIYNPDKQLAIAREVLDVIEAKAAAISGMNDVREQHYPALFEQAEADLLKVAVLFKDSAFREESEWRLVSGIVTNYAKADMFFREGRSMITPYLKFKLPNSADRKVEIEHVCLGPTPHPNAAMTSAAKFFTKMGASPRLGISYSNIPYRTT